MEDLTEKHPVTPGEVLPAGELLADMFFELGDHENALRSYESVLQKSPDRFNSFVWRGQSRGKTGKYTKSHNVV